MRKRGGRGGGAGGEASRGVVVPARFVLLEGRAGLVVLLWWANEALESIAFRFLVLWQRGRRAMGQCMVI